jgi:hypothetical protein
MRTGARSSVLTPISKHQFGGRYDRAMASAPERATGEPGRSVALAVGYLAAQAVLGVVWWCLLVFSPDVRSAFELAGDRHQALDAFLVADAAIFIGGSALGAWSLHRGARWATPVLFFTAGGTAYATLYLAEWVALRGDGALGLAPMIVAAAVTAAIAVRTWREGA